ncbi:MAG: hypothetical protein IAE92_09750 [Burkholderiaceae bacterium]|nr:hypothetical protein [Burkholderiaceae bacterium]
MNTTSSQTHPTWIGVGSVPIGIKAHLARIISVSLAAFQLANTPAHASMAIPASPP